MLRTAASAAGWAAQATAELVGDSGRAGHREPAVPAIALRRPSATAGQHSAGLHSSAVHSRPSAAGSAAPLPLPAAAASFPLGSAELPCPAATGPASSAPRSGLPGLALATHQAQLRRRSPSTHTKLVKSLTFLRHHPQNSGVRHSISRAVDGERFGGSMESLSQSLPERPIAEHMLIPIQGSFTVDLCLVQTSLSIKVISIKF